jgi:hypothetical protein
VLVPVVAILVIVFRSDLDAGLIRSVRDCAIGHSVPLWIFLSCSQSFSFTVASSVSCSCLLVLQQIGSEALLLPLRPSFAVSSTRWPISVLKDLADSQLCFWAAQVESRFSFQT